jgi:hypothetical protein
MKRSRIVCTYGPERPIQHWQVPACSMNFESRNYSRTQGLAVGKADCTKSSSRRVFWSHSQTNMMSFTSHSYVELKTSPPTSHHPVKYFFAGSYLHWNQRVTFQFALCDRWFHKGDHWTQVSILPNANRWLLGNVSRGTGIREVRWENEMGK